MNNRTSQPSKPSVGPTTSSKRSGPYDANYQLKLAQAGIHLTEETDENEDIVKPANHDEIMERLSKPRASLSPSRFPEQEYQRFRRLTRQATLESETMSQSIAIIEGKRGQFLSRKGGLFNNIKQFDPDIAMALPDSYDGAPPLSIDHRVLHDLDQFIVPNTDTSRPAAPNFFLEGKSRKGRANVAERQAGHVGALGARGMISLQSYPSGVSQYDGNAYSFTNIYHDGTLKMYTTHATAPREPDGHPSYYMTQIKAYAMTGDSDTFRRGATHYRNARDLAKEQRDSFIQQANQAARKTPTGKHSSRSRTTRDTESSVRTDSQSRGNRHSPDTQTSVDDLVVEFSSKRPRTGLSFEEDPTPPRRPTITSRGKSASTPEIREDQSTKTL